jgi:imidazolonepropionase-like amidohydrolase
MLKRLIPASLLVAAFSVAGLTEAGPWSQTPATESRETVIKAAKVYTAAGPVLAPGMVRVADGKIAEVAETLTVPAGARVIDLGAGVLIPGLVDAHTTLGIDGESSEITREITPNFRVLEAVDWFSRAFRASAAEGTTTACVVPGTEDVIAGLSGIVKTAGEPAKRVVRGEHALVITLASDPSNRNSVRNRPDSIYNRQPTNRMGVVWMLRAELARAKQSTDKDTAVVRDALAGKRPVVCVSRLDADLVAALRLRQEYPMQLTIAGGHEAYKLKDDLAAAKVPVLLGPLSTTPGTGPEQTETVLNCAGELHAARVPFALTGGRLLEQMRFAARFGLKPDAALASVTASPAGLLGVSDRLGTIARGKDADLVALTGDPFDLTATVRWTMIDGVIRSEER